MWNVSDVSRHKKGLTPAQKRKWTAIANSVLKDSGDEGMAIRIANSKCVEGKMHDVNEAKEKHGEIMNLTGKTKSILDFVDKHWTALRKEAEEKVIKPEKYWSFLTGNMSKAFGIKSEDLLRAGMEPQIIVNSIPVVGLIYEESPYKFLVMKDDKGNVKRVPIGDVLEKIKPFTKSFDKPFDALKSGRYDDVLKVLRQVYGGGVSSWGVPVEEDYRPVSRLSKLSALLVAGLARKEPLKLTNELVEKFSEAFDKNYRDELEKLFPHVDPSYLNMLIQEAKSALDSLGADTVAKLFPNINPEYLKNLKERRVIREKSYNCECLKCGRKMISSKHCRDIKCSECGGEMRRIERPGPGWVESGNKVAEQVPAQELGLESEPDENEGRYDDDKFTAAMERLIGEMSPAQILAVPGVYDVFSEEYNNEILDIMDEMGEEELEPSDEEEISPEILKLLSGEEEEEEEFIPSDEDLESVLNDITRMGRRE